MLPLPGEKLLQYSFWRFVDTRPIVRPRLRMHLADILNSLLMYTVQLPLIKGVLPWYSHFRKHGFFCGFAVQISVRPLSRFLDPWRYCIQCIQNGEYSGGTESFVGITRQKQHLRPLCRTICKCELYCLSKRSHHFIDQQVITFHTFWDLISLHQKNTLKYILRYFSRLEFQQLKHTFPVCLHQVFILYRWNLARMLPSNVAKKRCPGIIIFGLFRK